MKHLEKLSNLELISATKDLVKQEREVLIKILHHFLEIENRKLHLEEGYGSMFQYAVDALGYSEAQAYRRISASRLLKELPEIENSLNAGSLNLTHLTQAREYFKGEAKKSAAKESEALSKNEKLEILYSLAHQTTRETEKIFAALDPEKIPMEKARFINENLTEIKFVVSHALFEKFNRFKMLDSHVQKNPTYAELFERLVDLALKEKEKEKYLLKGRKIKGSSEMTGSSKEGCPLEKEILRVNNDDVLSAPKNTSRARRIPTFIKRIVFDRDQGACAFKNPVTGKRCGSTYRLQFDHILPFAKDGDHSTKNIRVLCQDHNLLHATKAFGKEKMSQYH
jgi:hypothetical protein